MSRKLILLTPVLLIAGIAVQVIALALIVILWIPCLIWPEIINRPYQGFTRASARFMARSLISSGRKDRANKVETVA